MGERQRPVYFVGISGPSGAGKSSLASKLASQLSSPVKPIQLDWFFRPELIVKDEQWGLNWERPEGVDFARLRIELQKLKRAFENVQTVPDQFRTSYPNHRTLKNGVDLISQNWTGHPLGSDPIGLLSSPFYCFSTETQAIFVM